jgi:enoyl-CoA hydratase/carnithine racemase
MMGGVYREIIYEVEDPVATITLNRPSALNAWTLRMGAEFRHAVNRAENDPSVVGIVVTGAGRAFCAGADINLLKDLRSSDGGPEDDADLEVVVSDPIPADFDGGYTWLLAGKKPVVAAINGAIAGMAISISLCCDIRFMAGDAPLLTAFSQRGLIAEYGIGWLLPRVVGMGHTLDLLFSSRRITGEEAATIGLVNKALPAEEVLPHSIRYIQELAEKCSPLSLSIIKRQVYEHLTGRLGPAEKEARKLMMESFTRGEFREGVDSWIEKRPPRFGRVGAERRVS